VSKKKSSKKDKAKKQDLFSMMMAQSALFRDMVARFQEAMGFPTVTSENLTAVYQPVDALAKAPARAKPAKRSKSPAKAPAKKAAVSAPAKKSARKKPAAVKKAAPATKKAASKSAKKASARKTTARK